MHKAVFATLAILGSLEFCIQILQNFSKGLVTVIPKSYVGKRIFGCYKDGNNPGLPELGKSRAFQRVFDSSTHVFI